MKCVVTGQETNSMTKGIPLSREGRNLLANITSRYNGKLKDRFMKSFRERTNDSEEAAEGIAKLMAPKFSKHKVLKMLVNNTEEDLFKPFEEKEIEESVEEFKKLGGGTNPVDEIDPEVLAEGLEESLKENLKVEESEVEA